MAATTALRKVLNQGISSGNLVDTKIIVYSHRNASGQVCRPKALYANSHVLKTVPHFNKLLFGGFSESQSRDFKEEFAEEEFADGYGYLSDSDLEDDEDEKIVSFKRKTRSKAQPFDPFAVPGEDRKLLSEENEEHVEKGKVVKISDVAFVTFQAFLMYLYTGVIEFAPFGSEENRRSRSAEIFTPSDDKVPRPSPKSIYRLAEIYDIPALKILALDHIRGEIAKCDIIEETFSRFASQYNEIRSLYIQQLAYAWIEDSTMETTCTNVEEKVKSFAEGDLEHATDIISALWEIANKDGEIKAPANTPSATTQPAQPTSPARWTSVKIAVIKSIRKGVFFDRKYWARHSKAGDVLKPVYFSSTIMNDETQQVNKLVKYIKGQNVTTNDLEGDLNVESDCETDPMGIGLETLTIEEKEEETRAVLITGSFSAWKSLFFYCCTDAILFAPLKSQGVESRLKYIREKTGATRPPPCSPKSIYVLAKLLGIEPLYDSAFADIKSKVSAENVVDEAFSWLTAGHKDIMEMQCDLLTSDFKDPKTIDLVKKNIEQISDGSLPHRADSLNLGLRKAFNLKKQGNGVMLQCVYYHCSRSNNHVAYSSQQNSCCSYCGNWMQCVGCRTNLNGDRASCRSCGKRFA